MEKGLLELIPTRTIAMTAKIIAVIPGREKSINFVTRMFVSLECVIKLIKTHTNPLFVVMVWDNRTGNWEVSYAKSADGGRTIGKSNQSIYTIPSMLVRGCKNRRSRK